MLNSKSIVLIQKQRSLSKTINYPFSELHGIIVSIKVPVLLLLL